MILQFLEVHDDFIARSAFLRCIPILKLQGVTTMCLEMSSDQSVTDLKQQFETQRKQTNDILAHFGLPTYIPYKDETYNEKAFAENLVALKAHARWNAVPPYFKECIEENALQFFNDQFLQKLISTCQQHSIAIECIDSPEFVSWHRALKQSNQAPQTLGIVTDVMKQPIYIRRIAHIRQKMQDIKSKSPGAKTAVLSGVAHVDDLKTMLDVKQICITANWWGMQLTIAQLSQQDSNSRLVRYFQPQRIEQEIIEWFFMQQGDSATASYCNGFMKTLFDQKSPYWMQLYSALVDSKKTYMQSLGTVLRRISTVKSQEVVVLLFANAQAIFPTVDIRCALHEKVSPTSLSASERFKANNINLDMLLPSAVGQEHNSSQNTAS